MGAVTGGRGFEKKMVSRMVDASPVTVEGRDGLSFVKSPIHSGLGARVAAGGCFDPSDAKSARRRCVAKIPLRVENAGPGLGAKEGTTWPYEREAPERRTIPVVPSWTSSGCGRKSRLRRGLSRIDAQAACMQAFWMRTSWCREEDYD